MVPSHNSQLSEKTPYQLVASVAYLYGIYVMTADGKVQKKKRKKKKKEEKEEEEEKKKMKKKRKKKKKKKKKKGTQKSNVKVASCENKAKKILISSSLYPFCQPIVSEFFKGKSAEIRSI